MPDTLAPGVYVEEVSLGSKSIEGVDTATALFVGPTRRGPIGAGSRPLASLREFEQSYGGPADLDLADVSDPARKRNFVAHAVRAFFENGGSRLHIVRTGANSRAAAGVLIACADDAKCALWRARFPGAACNGVVRLRVDAALATAQAVDDAPDGSMMALSTAAVTTHWLKTAGTWTDAAGDALTRLAPADATASLLTLAIDFEHADGGALRWTGLGFGTTHPGDVGMVLARDPAERTDGFESPIWFDVGARLTAFDLLAAIAALLPPAGSGESRACIPMNGGTDGDAPTCGDADSPGSYASALAIAAGLDEVSVVAAPGASAYADAQAIENQLIAHAEDVRYRIAVLDSGPQQTPGAVRDARARIDSSHAALYYPWVIVANPNTAPGCTDASAEISVPPSGFIAGLYARNDRDRGVHHAPANELVTGALRLERDIDDAQQEVLNPLGINCLRHIPDRGYRVWGARLASSDPAWKYVSLRRYFIYLEASIDRGTQWVVFERNGDTLWMEVTRAVSAFLRGEWQSGALLGTKPDEAWFVRCDRTTMTQDDIDNGRLVCEIGIAVIRPAEFVIFRIRQQTADAVDAGQPAS
jgi:phage tail sheath protein FI